MKYFRMCFIELYDLLLTSAHVNAFGDIFHRTYLPVKLDRLSFLFTRAKRRHTTKDWYLHSVGGTTCRV